MSGVICTTCMNARFPDEQCRETWQPCVLDVPTWADWQASGRGGENEDESRRLYLLANASFTAGLQHRVGGAGEGVAIEGDLNEACRFGHTDHIHVNLSSVGECRTRFEGDTCNNPSPAPFVCACIAEPVAFRAQDELGEQPRFYFVMIGLLCAFVSVFMLFLNMLFSMRSWLRRRFFHNSKLNYTAPPADDGAMEAVDKMAALDRAAKKAIKEELDGLWQCAMCTTFVLALVGGPTILWLAIPQDPAYWVGCGFRIPAVVVARGEFGLLGANAAGG